MFAESCPSLVLHNGDVKYSRSQVNERYPINTVAVFKCHYGYSQSGSGYRRCEPSGKWNKETPTCTQSTFIMFPQINLLFTPTKVFSRTVNVLEIFLCLFVVTCPALSLLNGKVSYNETSVNERYPVDTEALFLCDSGFLPFGFDSSICNPFGNWSQSNLTCKGKALNSIFLFKIIFYL